MLESFLLSFVAMLFCVFSTQHIVKLLVDLLTLSLQSIDHIELLLKLDFNLAKLGLPDTFELILTLEATGIHWCLTHAMLFILLIPMSLRIVINT